MSNMINKAQGFGLSVLTKLASSEVLDQMKLRKWLEKSLYHSSKTGFRTLSQTQKIFKKNQSQEKTRLGTTSTHLFDLNLSDEQRMTVEAITDFAEQVLKPLASQADHEAKYPEQLHQYIHDLGLHYYALPEHLGGVANEQSTVTNVLIAEYLARGDLTLSAGMLSTFSAINCLTRWGNQEIQNRYLAAFTEEGSISASFAVEENTPAFNPYQLRTHATFKQAQYYLSGEKTLVFLAEQADFFIVSAMYNNTPELFVVEATNLISIKNAPAMGLKALETATLHFDQTPAQRLTDHDFQYTEFLNFGYLMWGALAVGTCEAIKTYCIQYANERTAFGEPISHRQSVAFMIADMAIEIEAMRLLVWNAASLAETGQDFNREAYLARLLCAEKAMKTATDGVQILGGHGFTKEHPVERWYRDLRAIAINHSGLHA
jgi:alkylation response protein AidB-like acyl-CoA dehydrogenase